MHLEWIRQSFLSIKKEYPEGKSKNILAPLSINQAIKYPWDISIKEPLDVLINEVNKFIESYLFKRNPLKTRGFGIYY